MELLLWSIVLVISLTLLIKSSDFFSEAAETIGLFFKLPRFIIGVTVVAIGTSLPELSSSIVSVIEGSTEFVPAAVVGSNIANIFLVLGVASIVRKKIKISYDLIHVDIPLFIGSAAFVSLAAWDGTFTFGEGVLSIAALILYFTYAINTKGKYKKIRKAIRKDLADEAAIAKEMQKEESPLEYVTVVILIISLIVIFISAKFTVDSVVALASLLDIGTELITITAVSLGTSLPELAVSLSSAKNGKAEMVIGNVLGSNIFNSLGVMGIASMFGTITVPSSLIAFGIPVMVIATLLYFFKIQEREITHWEGWMLVIFYLFFIGKTINLF